MAIASSTQSIDVSAAPADVMAVIADFGAYPEWAASVKACEVVDAGPDGRANTVRFVLDAGVVKDDYELAYTWGTDGASVSWRLVRSAIQKAHEGSYTLSATPSGTRVTYALAVDLSIPMLGLLRRKAERVVMDTALKELKKRVER